MPSLLHYFNKVESCCRFPTAKFMRLTCIVKLHLGNIEPFAKFGHCVEMLEMFVRWCQVYVPIYNLLKRNKIEGSIRR